MDLYYYDKVVVSERPIQALTNVASNVLKLWPVSDELFLRGNVDAHVTREPNGGRGNSDMDLLTRKYCSYCLCKVVFSSRSAAYCSS